MSQAAAHNHASQQDWGNFTDMPVGEILRRTRLHYGQSLTDVETILRIRAIQLQALEDGRIDLLPGRVYAIGFVRAYAEYLGLDGEKMVHLFKAQAGNPPKPRAELHFPVPASESKVPNYYVLGSSVAGVVLVLAMLAFFMSRPDGEPVAVPEVPAALRAEALVTQPPPVLAQAQPILAGPVDATAIAAPVTAAATAPALTPAAQALAVPAAGAQSAAARAELKINVTETAWVEVRGTDGRILLSRVLKPGDSYTVPPGPGMVLDTGNIGGLEFVLNGEKLPPLGAKGDVRRKVSLDPAKLIPVQARRTNNDPAAAAAAIAPAAGRE